MSLENQSNTLPQEFSYRQDSGDELLESSQFQEISQTRLWKEIFYLRRQVAQKDSIITQMNNNMQSLQSKLQLEARNNAVLKNQLTHLRDNYF